MEKILGVSSLALRLTPLYFLNPNLLTPSQNSLLSFSFFSSISLSSLAFTPPLHQFYIYFLYLSFSLFQFSFLFAAAVAVAASACGFRFWVVLQFPSWCSNYQTHLASVVSLP